MFIARPAPENQAPSGAACRIGEQTNGSMPLLTTLAETVVGCDSYKHAAPTELGGCPGGTVAINMSLLT